MDLQFEPVYFMIAISRDVTRVKKDDFTRNIAISGLSLALEDNFAVKNSNDHFCFKDFHRVDGQRHLHTEQTGADAHVVPNAIPCGCVERGEAHRQNAA